LEAFHLPSISRLPTIYIDVSAGTTLVTWIVATISAQPLGVTVGLVVVVVVAGIVVVSLLVVVGTEVEDKEEVSMDAEDEVEASVLVKEEVSVVDAEDEEVSVDAKDEVEVVVLIEVNVPELVLMDVVEDKTVVEITPWHSEAGTRARSVTTHPCG
jgi:hypothetical protein